MGEAQTMAKVVWAWFYIMKTPDHESIITNIEGGTYRHVSIGFRAADLAPVKGPYDQTLYWEYAGPGRPPREVLSGWAHKTAPQHRRLPWKSTRSD